MPINKNSRAVAKKNPGRRVSFIIMNWQKWRYLQSFKAKELAANNIYLETNSILKPAISLYHKLGFQEIKGNISPYERSNYQMLLKLS